MLGVAACWACTSGNPDFVSSGQDDAHGDARADAATADRPSTDTGAGGSVGGTGGIGGGTGGATGGGSGSGGSGSGGSGAGGSGVDAPAEARTDTGPAGPPGPVSRWSMDEGRGVMIKDVVASHHGRLEGATWSSPGAPAAATSEACLAFDGTSAASAGVAGLPALNAPMTITLWMRPASLPSGKRTALALLQEPAGGSKVGVQLGQEGASAAAWFYGDSGTLLVSAGLAANTWSHVAYTFDGTTHRLSVGTAAQSSITRAAPTVAPTVLYFASFGTSASQRFVGQLDDVRIYDRALSAAEIRALARP